jgi:hypothetical protein
MIGEENSDMFEPYTEQRRQSTFMVIDKSDQKKRTEIKLECPESTGTSHVMGAVLD